MQFCKKIMFPVDLSEVSPKIAPYVREMAAKFDAEVHLLFVARILLHFTSIYPLSEGERRYYNERESG